MLLRMPPSIILLNFVGEILNLGELGAFWERTFDQGCLSYAIYAYALRRHQGLQQYVETGTTRHPTGH